MSLYRLHKNIDRNKKISLVAQSGATMIVVLILLLLMTIVGVSAMRGSNLQEQMAGNMRDRQIAFQAGEAANRVGEDAVMLSANLPNTSGAQQGFMQANNGGGGFAFWDAYAWDANLPGSAPSNLNLEANWQTPRYVVEALNVVEVNLDMCLDVPCVNSFPKRFFYRVTSRGFGMTQNTNVFIQTVVARYE
ncbi:MAG TPA: PilX N-terminal domain-containing pilus assembly protein [Cellvibrio sp.]|nr:PilX N-terminal domain-containing pilus assembly protein [Cellvibrio sp.]